MFLPFLINMTTISCLGTQQKSLLDVFVGVYVNLCTVTVIELIVFSYNEVIVQYRDSWSETCNN